MNNRRWYVYGVITVVLGYLLQSPYLAYAGYVFLLLLAIAHYSSKAWVSGLDCSRTLSQTIVRQGEQLTVKVTVTNERGWPIPWIYLEDVLSDGFHKSGQNCKLAILMPRQSITLDYKLTALKRGYHRIGPLMMESGDLFGLQRRYRTGAQQDYVSVLPTVAYIETYTIASRRPQGPIRISNRIYEDPTHISGVREYVQGDPLNRIHWKASARTGALYSKTNDPSSVTGGTLVLDLFRNNYLLEKAESRMELAITVTASIAYLLQTSGEQVGMITNAQDAAEVAKFEVEEQSAFSRSEAHQVMVKDDESTRLSPLQVPTLRSPIQARSIVENLARVVPGDALDAQQLIMNEFRRLPRDAALLLVAPQVDETLALTLGEMKLNGFAVSVFLIDDQKAYEEAALLLASHQIHVFHIEHERDLHELSPAKIGH